MTRQETLASLQLLLEYARDELSAVGLRAAATLADDAMVIVQSQLRSVEPSGAPKASVRTAPFGKLHLVSTRRTSDRTRGGR